MNASVDLLCRYRSVPGFGDAVACPAARGLAEHVRQLALRKRPARLEAGPVGGHRSSVGLALIAGGISAPGVGTDLVRVLVRMVWRRALAWSALLVRSWSAGRDLRTTPGCRHEADPRHPVIRRGFGRAGARAPVAWMVRGPACVVRCWSAVQAALRCGTDDPHQQLIAAHEADRGPGRDDRADWSAGPALGHVRGERRDDAEREQPGRGPGAGAAPRRGSPSSWRTRGRRSWPAPAGR
jgi:hypothetical protein